MAIMTSGVVLVGVSIVLPERKMEKIDVQLAAGYLGWVALLNAGAASVFTIPVLIPPFEFPILITRWPGIYIVLGYTFFVTVGVLGTFAWSVFYRLSPELISRKSVYKYLFVFQFISMETGVYLMSTFMFLGGYVGSRLVYGGAGDAVVGTAMEFAVIPSALGILLIAASSLIGVANALLSKRGL